MNIRDQIYSILATLPYEVFSTKIDPFVDSYSMPGISVQNREVKRKLIGDQVTFDTNTTIDIYIILDQPENYDASLDDVVELVLTKLLTNAAFMAQFSNDMSVDTLFEYTAAGDKNIAKARITFMAQYREQFDPDITAILEKVYTDWDFANTVVDPNLKPDNQGPDGRVELSSHFITQ